MSFGNDGELYTFGITSPANQQIGLVRVDIETGHAEDVDPELDSAGLIVQGLTVATDGNLYGTSLGQLFQVNLDGTILPIGPGTAGDIRGLAGVAAVLLGDVNCDFVVDLLDVEPFVDALTSGEFNDKADINSDGSVNLLDVPAFIDLLSGS